MSPLRRWLSGFAFGLFGLALCVGLAQVSCAEVEKGWSDEDHPDMMGDGDVGNPDGPPALCFAGTPTNEYQLLNKCTDAEHIERQSHIPPTTWDGKSPLP